MKYITLFLLLTAFHSAAQTTVPVTMSGIGNFKLNMTKSEVEQLTGKPVQLANLLRDDWNFDTVACNAGGLDVELVFDRRYTDDKHYDCIVRSVSSKSRALKTPSGIAIGDDKYKIISTYEAYTIWIVPDWEDDHYTNRSKTRSSIFLQGDGTGNVIIFYMEFNKIVGMSVTWAEAYD